MDTTSASPIHLDSSTAMIVIYCDDHPWWRACRFHLDEAHDAACAHEAREHAGDNHRREARRQRLDRHERRVASERSAERTKRG